MASNKDSNSSITGQVETAEPAPLSRASTQRDTSPSLKRDTASSTSIPTLRKQPSVNLTTSLPPSTGSSPKTSRNNSPIRPSLRQDTSQTASRAAGLRSRKNSHDASPSRPSGSSNVPSAAAIQRALSATSVPQLQPGPVTEAVSKLPRTSRSAAASGENTPNPAQWPLSPRMKSPPPSQLNSRRNSLLSQRKSELAPPPSVTVQSSTPPAPTTNATENKADSSADKEQLHAPGKAPSRGPSGPKSSLETVEENTPPAASVLASAVHQSSSSTPTQHRTSDDDKSIINHKRPSDESSDKPYRAVESESEGNKSDGRGRPPSINTVAAQRLKQAPPKSAHTPLSSAKSRTTDSIRNMTVETETVSSIPQSALNTDRSGAGRGDGGGSVRLKPSNETIRPRKEKKKPSRKAPSVHNGTGTFVKKFPILMHRHSVASLSSEVNNSPPFDSTDSTLGTSPSSCSHQEPRFRISSLFSPGIAAKHKSFPYMPQSTNVLRHKASSKADIFEARVASVVDEANSSDSDETFVYESNPPEQQHRSNRNHSRTPSATSAHSQSERRVTRGYSSIIDAHRVAGKRSMKFSNNPYNLLDSPELGDGGTIRAHHPRHVSRLGRTMGSHSSLYDPDSPFTQASKLRSGLNGTSRQGSRPTTPVTPRSAPAGDLRVSGAFRKPDLSQYDFEGEGADDERTPLMSTIRTPRNARHVRRYDGSRGSTERIYNIRHTSWLGRFGGCLLGFVVLVLVIAGASGFLAMSNKTMYDVEVRKIQNVLASEQEIMLDLLVGAINPNVLGVTVTEMDVNVFAKSKHLSVPRLHPDPDVDESARHASPEGQAHSLRRLIRDSRAGTPWQDPDGHWEPDEGRADPVEGDSQTMLLGRIFHFDQALYFEGSPVKRHAHFSTGEMRLARPGNKTEAGGSDRWERVIQFPFELILRGVLKYQLPISNREQTAAIAGSVIVHPEEGVDESGNMLVEEVNRGEQWQWIENGDASTDGQKD